jgi:transcription elongation GreA/GreB family factor
MHKPQLLELITTTLARNLDIAQRAAQTAYETATHEENVAENKYDTLGLEASYLATGQARRTEEIRQALLKYQGWVLRDYDDVGGIQIGTLVTLENPRGESQRLFLGPDAAGLILMLDGQQVTVITPRAPLGMALLGKFEGDEVSITVSGTVQVSEIVEAR